ncbi:hypothetical protein D3C79_663570 [compost metagenome]
MKSIAVDAVDQVFNGPGQPLVGKAGAQAGLPVLFCLLGGMRILYRAVLQFVSVHCQHLAGGQAGGFVDQCVGADAYIARGGEAAALRLA